MADVAQKLTLLAELLGDKQVIDGLNRMSAAQGQATSAVSEHGKKLEDNSPKQDDATLKMKDFTNVLGIIDPRLQSIASRLFRTGEAFGDLGTKSIDFATVGKGLVETLTKMGPALALLAAGAGVALGLGAITSAMAKMGEETAKATEQLERQRKVANELRNTQAESKKSIEGISDARKRGGFDADTSRKAQSTAETIKRRFPQLDYSAIQQAVGNLFDVTQDPNDLAEAAFLLQTDDKFKFNRNDTAGRAGSRFQRSRSRNPGAFNAFQKRETKQERELAGDVRLELMSEGGSTRAIEEFIRNYVDADLPDEDRQALIKRLEEFKNRAGLERKYVPFEHTDPRTGVTYTQKSKIEDPVDINAVRFFNELEKRDQPLTTPKTPGAPMSINIHHNSRFIAPFARGQEQARVNGESRAQAMEMV